MRSFAPHFLFFFFLCHVKQSNPPDSKANQEKMTTLASFDWSPLPSAPISQHMQQGYVAGHVSENRAAIKAAGSARGPSAPRAGSHMPDFEFEVRSGPQFFFFFFLVPCQTIQSARFQGKISKAKFQSRKKNGTFKRGPENVNEGKHVWLQSSRRGSTGCPRERVSTLVPEV